MNLKHRILPFILSIFLLFFSLFLPLKEFFHVNAAAAEKKNSNQSVELNGDVIDYSMDGNVITAKGNVVVVYKGSILKSDELEFSRDTMMADAKGNVQLQMDKGEIVGDKLKFNFGTKTGTFYGANITSTPYYGKGKEISKLGEDKIEMNNGSYLTTCDYDKPHFKLASKKMEVYPGDKLIARHVRFILGKLPILYIPKFKQNIGDKPMVTFTPGMDKEWGLFLLSNWRYRFNENLKGIVHIDAREKKDLAWGIDVNYKTLNYGTGDIVTYYMNERSITSKRFYRPRPSPTIEKERFKVRWRHQWEINDKTDAILQYYKISDSTFLDDFFDNESEKDISPNSFFLLTRRMLSGVTSFRTDVRVNRFTSAVERLPELRYDLGSLEIADTGLFFSNTSTYSNLTKKTASPSEVRKNTMRVDTDSTLSYPLKIGIFELNPSVGGEHTYYSKTIDRSKYGSVRGIFRTGASLSTKFYRIFDIESDSFGMDIHRLRHIVTPSASYTYDHGPTIPSDQFDAFDGIDSRGLSHRIDFSLENKLQTKRNGSSVDLLRLVIGAPFFLKEDSSKGGFSTISADIDYIPTDNVRFYFDAAYDPHEEYLTSANFDLYINGGDKWSADFGKRWSREVDDQLTSQFMYKINPKWRAKTYTRFDLRSGILKEQEFTVTRDMHAWEMDLNFNEKRNFGNEIWIVFRLKAFPNDLAVEFGSSFNKRKLRSQSTDN